MWWKLLAKLAEINPADPVVQLNIQDLLDIIQQAIGG